MRAYVIKEELDDVDATISKVIGVASSKRHAISAIEDHFLNADINHFEWEEQGKHTGHAYGNFRTVSYQMFFINQLETVD